MTRSALDDFWTANGTQLRATRHDIHAHPELCFAEERTSALIAERLQSWGITVHRGLGKTGVLGVIKKGNSARTIGLRADMDALPIQEANRFAHASRHAGRMHACGHDGHCATLLATAQYLAQHAVFDGTVYLIFQPAEEGGGGAKAMMDDGLFQRFPMDAVYALHNWPGMPVGSVAASAGPVMGSSNEFKITILGKGCHAAMPHLGQDPVLAAAALIQGFQTIVSRNLKPIDDSVISVTIVRAGEASNVIANSCTLEGTVRTFSLEVLDTIETRMHAMTQSLCLAYGCKAEFVFERNYPPTINHAAQAQIVREVASTVFGADHVHAQEPTMGAEDFAYMLQDRPGCYFFLGNGDGAHRENGHGMGPCMLHNPSYDFNDDLIKIGLKMWTGLVQHQLPASPTTATTAATTT